MKKVCACALLLLLLAPGCGITPPTPFAPASLPETGFTLQTGETRIEGTLACDPAGEIRLRFSSPPALTYLTATYADEVFRLDVAGAADTVAARELPTFAPVLLLCETLRDALFTQREFKKDGGAYVAALTYGGEKVACRFSPDGRIRRIDCEAKQITIDFQA